MSGTLKVNAINSLAGRPLILPNGNHLVNFSQVYFTDFQNFSCPNTGNGNPMYPLTLTINPKASNNILIMEWMISGEEDTNIGILIHRNGALVTTAGQQGYNNQSGNVRWSCIHAGWFDNNNDSTPSNYRFTYQCITGSTSTLNFVPAVRSTDGTNRNFRLNRSFNSGFESNTSYGFIMEFSV